MAFYLKIAFKWKQISIRERSSLCFDASLVNSLFAFNAFAKHKVLVYTNVFYNCFKVDSHHILFWLSINTNYILLTIIDIHMIIFWMLKWEDINYNLHTICSQPILKPVIIKRGKNQFITKTRIKVECLLKSWGKSIVFKKKLPKKVLTQEFNEKY